MKWNKIWSCDWAYVTSLPVSECITRLCSPPWIFGVDYFRNSKWTCRENHFKYECYPVSECQLYLRFNGAHYGGTKRTEYVVNFFQLERATRIELLFLHELWGLPPLTSTQELDEFMKEKIDASRVSLKSIRPGDGSFSWKKMEDDAD